jgi:outer membrane usher protein
MWGRNMYFGGVQYGTNFALTPGFVSQPLPSLRGLSAAPSTVELYVNDVLRQVSNIPTGPFAIDNFPVMTGSGEARLVVRDLLGRETVLVQSFFASSLLLAKNLDDWSVEAGKVRLDLGVESASYGDAFASGTWRRGITIAPPSEGRAETPPGCERSVSGSFRRCRSIARHHGSRGSNHRTSGAGAAGCSAWSAPEEQSRFQAKGATQRFRLLGRRTSRSDKLQVAGTGRGSRRGGRSAGFATSSAAAKIG